MSLVSFFGAGTNSTNAVGGPGQNQTQPPSTASQSRKGTFTDDLHKLVDNWARDAMSLTQGKRGTKAQQQAPSQGHSFEVRPSSFSGVFFLFFFRETGTTEAF